MHHDARVGDGDGVHTRSQLEERGVARDEVLHQRGGARIAAMMGGERSRMHHVVDEHIRALGEVDQRLVRDE